MSKKHKSPTLPTRFADFYRSVLGMEADMQIQMLLAGVKTKVVRAIPSRFEFDALRRLVGEFHLAYPSAGSEPRVIFDDAMLVSSDLAGALSRCTAFEEGKFYIQSFPSYFVIKMLPMGEAEYVLDVCASPGGKAIHCYDRLNRTKPVIVNEPAGSRRMRLTSVLRTYGADELPALGIDGGLICQYVVNEIPLVVLDAPCSGEAHILSQPQRRNEWTPRQSKMLAQRQLSLAVSAAHALRPGGHMLYSTCAMSPYENELLIQELLNRMGEAIEPMPWPEESVSELSRYTSNFSPLAEVEGQAIDSRIVQAGWRFRPSDFGEPFFGILLKKVAATQPKKSVEPFPLQYERGPSKNFKILKVGPGRREFRVPAGWPELPPLPYLHIGG
jgi:16S rRNA C967 or C1407 C5-methylase (RsmB/RsmF family)